MGLRLAICTERDHIRQWADGVRDPAGTLIVAMETLTPLARRSRVAVTIAGLLLLLAGTLWGSDDHFPFGPFSMYAGVNRLDDPAPDTRVEGTDVTGATVLLTEANTGIKRAEIEGQIDKLRSQPALLDSIAAAYADRNPAAPALTEVRVVIRWHELRGGKPTGVYRDEVASTWQPA
ncbi:hypothetical protein [Luedemannella helvata]|uniref:Uncharacterized protein n=1 Tax=Luedemannella helvata TaxID=349315 RepID=A0ABP4XH71_9ACTN